MLYVLQYVYLLVFVTCVTCEFWLSAGMSGYTVVNPNGNYTELVIHSPAHEIALVITDDEFIIYNKYRSYHCQDLVCGVSVTNYHSMIDCALNNTNTKEVLDANGNVVYAKRVFRGHSELLVNFKIKNISDNEAFGRIMYLIGQEQ